MNALSDRPRNRLLLALSSRNLKRLMPDLEHIRCQREQVLLDADGSLDHVFFPESGDVGAARIHATGVARELTAHGGGILQQGWSGWTMSVHDEHGTQLFSLTMSDFGDGKPEK
jgi:hypothetical protein